MRKRSFKAASLAFTLFLLLVITSSAESLAQNNGRRRHLPQGKDTVLFDTANYGVERIILPIVMLRGGRYVAPPSFDSKAARRRFASAYYRAGQKYRLLFGGNELGTVSVKDLKTCDTTAANVLVQTSTKFEGRGLVTNSASLGRKPINYRDLTESEKTAIMKLVQPSFRRAGVDVPEFEGVVNGAVAADMNGDGKAELIGTFATGAKMQHTLFIIAEPQGKGYKATLLLFQAAKDEYGDHQIRWDLLDGIDLDGDGINEVIISVNDYRSPDDWNYIIYKKQAGRWRSVYSGGGMRCPYESGGHKF
jgi:hypothetical protein